MSVKELCVVRLRTLESVDENADCCRMLVSEAREKFQARVASARRIEVDELDPLSAVEHMVDFFADTEAENAEYEAVYLTWGTYNRYDGLGPEFQYVVWRQLFVAGTAPEDADDGIWELEIRFGFTPDAETEGVGAGGLDCDSPEGAANFKALVAALRATELVRARTPASVEFTFGQGG